jgi:hypothetical protein
MTTAQVPRITPPPSVEAVLGALTEETRIGQVDFSSRLTDPDEHDAEPGEALQTASTPPHDMATAELAEEPAVEVGPAEYGEEHTAQIHSLVTPTPAVEIESSGGADERPPTVEEIARLVVERMHDAELAMMRHLEAVQVEGARRAELATAQAELDAELIRLNARREAHSLITAARRRAGQPVAADPAETELDEIAESLTRFADVVDELRPVARPGRPA